jgi:hypothetical protein
MAKVIRSKNAGPFELTFDVFFKEESGFLKARESGYFAPEQLAGLFGITREQVLGVIWFAPASALKITISRTIPSGSPGDRDVYGAQQHAPLMELEIK